jgi:hypothetical protein
MMEKYYTPELNEFIADLIQWCEFKTKPDL